MRTWAGMLAAGLLVLSGCGDSGGARAQAAADGPAADGPAAAATDFSVTPPDGARGVGPDTTVKVTGAAGPLGEVRVTDGKGRALDGAYSPDHVTWTSMVPVKVGTQYTVQAWGGGEDRSQLEKVTRFSTTDVERSGTLDISSVQPSNGATVGVAHPLIVTFNQPVPDRAIVQKALQVKTTPAVQGAWYWIDNETVDYRPQQFWPPNTKVALVAKLAGISAGDGVVGGKDRTSAFTVTRSQVLKVDVVKHKLTVVRGGKQIKSFDVSTGKPGWETRKGTKVIMEKERNKVWTDEAIDAKEDYRYTSKYAMRVTNSGEFLHDAPWNSGNIGEANTSHGCIGLLPKSMEWLYENTMVGDPVVVTGSPKPFDDLTNRIADWNITWAKWSAGNTHDQL
ncbi:MAG TPA: Ig-like domain-containing protein [Sporichthya sp.]|nr:Ig-like domain-containing protein [Sporichthya sp.]